MEALINRILKIRAMCDVRKHMCCSMLLVAALCIVCAYGCKNTTDTTPPMVSFTNPANQATDVPINRKITATFTEAMRPWSVKRITFTLQKGASVVTGLVAGTGSDDLSALCLNPLNVRGRVDYIGTTAIFTPANDLEADTLYTATISTRARDFAGNVLESAWVWSFTTGANTDTTAPAVSFVNPVSLAADVPINRKITITFTEAMRPQTINRRTFTLQKGSSLVTDTIADTDISESDVSALCLNPLNVRGTVAYTGTTAIFTPASNLEANTLYTATISTGARDLAGNALESAFVWSFTTGADTDTTCLLYTSPSPRD